MYLISSENITKPTCPFVKEIYPFFVSDDVRFLSHTVYGHQPDIDLLTDRAVAETS